ncbi:hypothetical protein F7R02_19580 [Xanthomonas cissicola]|nr:hypothetical protein F7R02_19580 [Xanthomonas cissicola]
MDEAKAVAAGYGERAPVNQEIPTESARNGEIPKIQTPLFGTTRHPALSGLVIQTFPRRVRTIGGGACRGLRLCATAPSNVVDQRCGSGRDLCCSGDGAVPIHYAAGYVAGHSGGYVGAGPAAERAVVRSGP